MSTITVFISHSHDDRDVATYLQGVLSKHGIATRLDQDFIKPGDDLSDEIIKAVEDSDYLLLLWSNSAANSSWVNEESELAYQLKKSIVPYKLDQTKLPHELERLVFVPVDDQEHSNSLLLQAILGRDYEPADPTELFPGKWRAEVTIPGLSGMKSIYDLELRPNGQIHGSFGLPTGGIMDMLGPQVGISDFLGSSIPFEGSWTYDSKSGYLILNVVSQIMGQRSQDVIRIKASGTEREAIRGSDGGKNYLLQRILA